MNESKETFDKEKVPELIDQWISCSLDTGDKVLDDLVKDVNVHKHTKSCLKYHGSCRYGFPKLPSPKTLIAKPLEYTYPDMEETEKNSIKSRARVVLGNAKILLDDPNFDETMSFADFYNAEPTIMNS